MGEVFAGRYELVDPLGCGGAGAVWRVWDRKRREYVAAKILQQRDATALLRFVREQALRFEHPHILAPLGWAAEDDKVLFTMGLVRGGSVSDLIRAHGPLPLSFSAILLDQLFQALDAVHREGFVHRDVKPANLLLEATGTGRPHLRLSDFGIAVARDEPRLTDLHFIVGTPGYLAPERLIGADPEPTQDLFSVGVVACQMLTGQQPPRDLADQLSADPGWPSRAVLVGFPEPIRAVVARLLAYQPEDRYATAAEARAALAQAMAAVPRQVLARFDSRVVEVPDRIGPLPEGFGPGGPITPAGAVAAAPAAAAGGPIPPETVPETSTHSPTVALNRALGEVTPPVAETVQVADPPIPQPSGVPTSPWAPQRSGNPWQPPVPRLPNDDHGPAVLLRAPGTWMTAGGVVLMMIGLFLLMG